MASLCVTTPIRVKVHHRGIFMETPLSYGGGGIKQLNNIEGLKEGWLEGCRKVIGLDGCFLKTIRKGELLSAVGRDGNNQIYPIAWAVVSVKNKDNWQWFMKLLIDDLGLVDGSEAAKAVMPLAEHRQCARHIYANFRKKFSGVHFRNLFWKASKSTYPGKFNEVMHELKLVNPLAYQYLMDRNPNSWSRAFFSTDKSCDVVKNRISECFNSLILEAREKPIINMLADIRICIMERMETMRKRHVKWHDLLCPTVRKKFEKVKELHRLTISPNVEVSFFKLLCTTDDIEDMIFDVYVLPCYGLVLFVMALFIHAL
ncbi:multidrug resistance-associated protein 5 [Tanacetum coccineum]